jgi:Domain of unknown function (DUF3597)
LEFRSFAVLITPYNLRATFIYRVPLLPNTDLYPLSACLYDTLFLAFKTIWAYSLPYLGKILGKGTPSTQSTAASGAQPPPTGSHSARIELAKELHYTGSTGDSATMNIWLHQQVIKQIAENGGKVPQELLKS